MELKPTLFDAARRDGYILDAMARHRVPGLAAAALRSGQMAGLWHYGVADEAGNPVGDDTVFEAASLTKTLFACLVLRLWEGGTLDLDAPMAALRPEPGLSQDPRLAAITPRQTLCHATGLPNWGAKPLPFRFDPGHGFGYSGEGYYYLQRLVEQLAGEALPALFKRHFFTPWAMAESSGIWHSGLKMAHGFNHAGAVCRIRDSVDLTGNAPEPNAAWSLYTSARDYAQYIGRLLRGEVGLRPETLAAMAAPQNSADEHIAWGLGWGLVKTHPGLLWHWGSNTGFQSAVTLHRGNGDGLVLMTNSDNGVAFTLELLQYFTGEGCFEHIGAFIEKAE